VHAQLVKGLTDIFKAEQHHPIKSFISKYYSLFDWFGTASKPMPAA
jgi:hypothetical protein